MKIEKKKSSFFSLNYHMYYQGFSISFISVIFFNHFLLFGGRGPCSAAGWSEIIDFKKNLIKQSCFLKSFLRTLKLHDIPVTQKLVKNVLVDLDFSKMPHPDFIPASEF